MWATRVRAPSCAWGQAAGGVQGVRARVLTHVDAGESRVIEEVDLSGSTWPEAFRRIEDAAGVHAADVLESTPTRARVRLLVDACPLTRAIRASATPPRFPFETQAGHDEWLLVGEREAHAAFVRTLEETGLAPEVLSTRAHHPPAGLTPRQRALVEAAREQGYYEVPRQVTLTELAQRLHIAKSTLSETLARAERRIVERLGP